MTGQERPSRSHWRVLSLWPLGYLGILVFQPIFDPTATGLDWALVVGVVAVFVPLYARATLTPGPLRRWAPALSTALGLLVTPVNSGATVLLVYAASFAGAHRPRRSALRWMAGLTVLLSVLAAISPIPFPYRIWAFAPAAIFVWIIGLTCLAEAERERESTELRVDNARIQHLATLSERDRISRDLHDLLGQALTGIVVRSQLAQRLTPGAPAAGVAEMAEVERAARVALAEVRATVQGWRQVMFDDELAVAREALAAAGVELVVARDPEVVLSPSAESALSLALREAVTNVVRHAQARRCTVRLGRRDGEVVLEIVDDGVGGGPGEGNGLIGMRERIAALGGNMTRGVRDGTAITVTVPAAVAT